jgi:hypothetical protein
MEDEWRINGSLMLEKRYKKEELSYQPGKTV